MGLCHKITEKDRYRENIANRGALCHWCSCWRRSSTTTRRLSVIWSIALIIFTGGSLRLSGRKPIRKFCLLSPRLHHTRLFGFPFRLIRIEGYHLRTFILAVMVAPSRWVPLPQAAYGWVSAGVQAFHRAAHGCCLGSGRRLPGL